MAHHKGARAMSEPTTNQTASDSDDDRVIWGAQNIAEELDCPGGVNQVYGLLASGALEGYVSRAGHRTIYSTERRLKRFKDGLPPASTAEAT
jgi:hypothetical protein